MDKKNISDEKGKKDRLDKIAKKGQIGHKGQIWHDGQNGQKRRTKWTIRTNLDIIYLDKLKILPDLDNLQKLFKNWTFRQKSTKLNI